MTEMGSAGEALIRKEFHTGCQPVGACPSARLVQKMDFGQRSQGRCVRDARSKFSIANISARNPRKAHEISHAFADTLHDGTLRIGNERDHPKKLMSAVLEPPHHGRGQSDAPTQSTPSSSEPAVHLATSTGLRPIQRLTSDSRIDKIVPDSDAVTILLYSSVFARTFIRSDYNFCAAKISVARGGKVRALETALRDTADWMRKATAWVERHNARSLTFPYEQIELKVTRPLAGLLVRCLTQYDRLFTASMEAQLAEMITQQDRVNILSNAEGRILHVKTLCIPDNDRYDADGTVRD